MPRYLAIFVCALIMPLAAFAQDSVAVKKFLAQQKGISKSFNAYFNANISTLYGSRESAFIHTIDSLRRTFLNPLDSFKAIAPKAGKAFFKEQYTDINYTFDRFILDYPPVHKRIAGQAVTFSTSTQEYINRIDIHTPELLQYEAFRKYLSSFLQQQTDKELQNNTKAYASSNNQNLDAGLSTINKIFKNPVIRNRMAYDLLTYHIENYGVKDLTPALALFTKMKPEARLQSTIDSLYQAELKERNNHSIEIYKQAGKFKLDAHIFKPADDGKRHPAIVLFHGGGWSEGKPDWFFSTCQAYQAKGWVAVAVEYRIRNRHGSLPPEAIADGKSAIRFLRQNATRLGIDPNHIVASGNSAGANLALATGVIDTLDEKTEDLHIRSTPDAIMVNSAGTDFTQGDFWQQYYTDKAFLKRISPLHQVRPKLPPMLVIHGSRDYNVPLAPTQAFAEQMKAAGNDCEFHIIEGAHHFLWYDPRFSKTVAEYRSAFLKRLSYP